MCYAIQPAGVSSRNPIVWRQRNSDSWVFACGSFGKTAQLKKVLVTSTIPEEGKSLVSANLAGVLARRKQKVLLIEGDLRRPTLAQQFGLGRLAGLAEWLQSGAQTPANIYRLGGPGFLVHAGWRPACESS